MEFQVHLGLKNGQTFNFFKEAISKDHIINEITNAHGNGWYHFMQDWVNYRVIKSEIVSIGISLTEDEVSVSVDARKVKNN